MSEPGLSARCKLAETEERKSASESQLGLLLFVVMCVLPIYVFLFCIFLYLLCVLSLFVVVKPYVMRNLTKISREVKIA